MSSTTSGRGGTGDTFSNAPSSVEIKVARPLRFEAKGPVRRRFLDARRGELAGTYPLLQIPKYFDFEEFMETPH